jgi:hypothetical protein
VVALPELERMLVEALAGIAASRRHRKPSRRLQWNRVLLHVWPVIDLSSGEIHSIMSRIAPAATGLGVEMLLVHGRLRPARRRRSASASCACSRRPGRASSSRSTIRRPSRYARSTRARNGSSPHAGAACCTRPRSSSLLAPARGDDAAAGGPLGEFVEHDLDASGGSRPSTARPPATTPASSSA